MNEFQDELVWQNLIAGIRTGNDEACREFWEKYGPMIERLADRNLATMIRRREGPDDVVQSACRTFFRRAQDGEFQLPNSNALWSLLCTITLNKIRQKGRFHNRKKRGMTREQTMETSSGSGVSQLAGKDFEGIEAVAFSDELEHVLSRLEEEERQVVDLKLQEFTNDEIAEKIHRSERSVRRILKRLQVSFQKMLTEN